jgi:hypothetical protein
LLNLNCFFRIFTAKYGKSSSSLVKKISNRKYQGDVALGVFWEDQNMIEKLGGN